jgi:signal transduction histidine kinase
VATFILCLIAVLIQSALFVFMAQLLPHRFKAWNIAVLLAVCIAAILIRLSFDTGSLAYSLANLSNFVVLTVVTVLLFAGKLWKRLVVYSYFVVIMALCDVIALSILSIHSGRSEWFSERGGALDLIGGTVALIIFILIGSLSVLAWRAIEARRFGPLFLLFFILPIGQLVTVYSFVFSAYTAFWLLGVILSLAADLVLLIYTVSQEKKTVLEDELRETRYTMELEQSHYRELEQRREELAKIRHDFNNQLASIGQLIRLGEKESAQDMISALSEEIVKTKENPYCTIPVVNAILTEKAQTCAAAGIILSVDLEFPASLAVEQIHLCSIFGNLLDNAISACEVAKHPETPSIRLKSMVDGKYLFIKVVNPSGEPKRDKAPGRGRGSRILADIAARYCGDYSAEYKDGMYTVIISLPAVK